MLLKLKVIRCLTPVWISNAQVSAVIYRQGSGQIGSDSGTTNTSGYVELSFDDVEAGDNAVVTVTPNGEGADGDHQFSCVDDGRGSCAWSVGPQGNKSCVDSWYDQANQIIQVSYHSS